MRFCRSMRWLRLRLKRVLCWHVYHYDSLHPAAGPTPIVRVKCSRCGARRDSTPSKQLAKLLEEVK